MGDIVSNESSAVHSQHSTGASKRFMPGRIFYHIHFFLFVGRSVAAEDFGKPEWRL
jgi:hypothetical protein